MHACAHEIDDIEFPVQSTYVCTRHLHGNLHERTCMPGMYMPNLVLMHIHIYYVTGFAKTIHIGTRNEIQFIADY